ncbi:MAG TPA: sigma-E factor negative regulatory protein [Gallionella sp.]|jgi:sigma-E factor negative regulatory protein RseA|nr:sigma-E factor negative regulatory protein [Gallionella sp.]
MKKEISALMDGELFEDKAEDLLNRIKRNFDAREGWETYHLIGDVLRQPEHIHSDLSAKVRERMQDEPVVLAPRGRAAKQKIRTVALSAAASLMAVGVVAWMSAQITPETFPQTAMQQAALHPASLQIKPGSSDYLMAHQEFSPSTDMSGGAAYIRTVAYGTDGK